MEALATPPALYPMHVVSTRDLLEGEGLIVHEELKRQGKLFKVEEMESHPGNFAVTRVQADGSTGEAVTWRDPEFCGDKPVEEGTSSVCYHCCPP